MKKNIHILIFIFFLIFGLGFNSYAQNLPVACGGDTVRYGVIGNNGYSVFDWNIEGGEIINNYNDSVDIVWTSLAGIRVLTVTETNLYGCEGEPYSQNLMVASPYVDLGLDQGICSGETYEFIASVSDVTSFLWQDEISIGETFIASETGDYWVRVTDENGCIASDTASLLVHDLPAVDLGNDTALCGPDAELVLDASQWGNSFYWSTSEISSTITLYPETEDREIWVEVTDENNCIGADTINIAFCGDFVIPNAFTPNEDGTNETWNIEYLFVFEKVTVDVFNRWGENVFHSEGYSEPWDGKNMKGKKLPMDTYYYVIDLHNGETPIAGNVTIIR